MVNGGLFPIFHPAGSLVNGLDGDPNIFGENQYIWLKNVILY